MFHFYNLWKPLVFWGFQWYRQRRSVLNALINWFFFYFWLQLSQFVKKKKNKSVKLLFDTYIWKQDNTTKKSNFLTS